MSDIGDVSTSRTRTELEFELAELLVTVLTREVVLSDTSSTHIGPGFVSLAEGV